MTVTLSWLGEVKGQATNMLKDTRTGEQAGWLDEKFKRLGDPVREEVNDRWSPCFHVRLTLLLQSSGNVILCRLSWSNGSIRKSVKMPQQIRSKP
jgi:hypothetical protein